MAVWTVAFAGSRPLATAVDTSLAGGIDAKYSALLALPALVTAAVIFCLRSSERGLAWGRRILEASPPAVGEHAVPPGEKRQHVHFSGKRADDPSTPTEDGPQKTPESSDPDERDLE
jgi:hypothetical protein